MNTSYFSRHIGISYGCTARKENKLFLHAIALSLSLLPMSQSHADPGCDAEVTAIQAELDSPSEGISADDLDKAAQLLKVVSTDCDAGTPFQTVQPIAQQIRSLLGMEDAS